MIQAQEELIQLTKKLITFQTVSDDPEAMRGCLDFIEDYLSGNSLTLRRFDVNGTPSLLVSTAKTNTPTLCLNGHIDVVGGSPDQFTPTIRSGRIYGRGAIDMKASIAAMMLLLKTYRGKNSIAAMFVSDEESDGEKGTKYILDQGFRPQCTIVTEESNFDITVKQKGGFVISVKTSGRKAHSSEPWKGVNAIDKAIGFYSDLRETVEKISSPDYPSTVTLGAFHGGDDPCFVADRASLKADIRFPDAKAGELIREALLSLGKQYHANITYLSKKNIMESSGCERQITLLSNLICDAVGRKPMLKKASYSGDGRFFTELSLPAVEFGPIGKNYHAQNEYVEIQSLNTYYEILHTFCRVLRA